MPRCLMRHDPRRLALVYRRSLLNVALAAIKTSREVFIDPCRENFCGESRKQFHANH
jgi:hypothetical protein